MAMAEERAAEGRAAVMVARLEVCLVGGRVEAEVGGMADT